MNLYSRLARQCFGLSLFLLYSISQFASAQNVDWVRLYGTSYADEANSVSADRLGNIYVAGYTGVADHPTSYNGFVSKYDDTGTRIWTQQLDINKGFPYGVATDGLGDAYVSGIGSLGGPNASGYDAFVSKYNSSGNLLWSRQLGTSGTDISSSVAADDVGNVYISGNTRGNLGGPNAGGQDAWVSKFDANGNQIWIQQFGTSGFDFSHSVSADSKGNVYVSGATDGNLAGINAGFDDAFVSKFDESGNIQWTRQFGGSDSDAADSVSTDGLGDVYTSGSTAYGQHGFVSKYDADGNLIWSRQPATLDSTASNAVSADGRGNVYVSGFVGLSGTAFVNKYDASGKEIWNGQLGGGAYGAGKSLSTDGLGHIYVAGYVGVFFIGSNAGVTDAFVAKFSDVPEPGSLVLVVIASVVLVPVRLWRRLRANG